MHCYHRLFFNIIIIIIQLLQNSYMPKLNFCIQCISSHNYYVPTVSSFFQHLRKRRQTIWRGFLHAEGKSMKSICTVYNWSAYSPAPSFANTTKIGMSLALVVFAVNPSCNLQFLRLVVLLGRFQDPCRYQNTISTQFPATACTWPGASKL